MTRAASHANFYVYYRVDPARIDELRGHVALMLDAIAQHCGVRGRWMRRLDDAGTFMEVYEEVADPASFRTLLEDEARRAGMERLLAPDSGRHTEVFAAA